MSRDRDAESESGGIIHELNLTGALKRPVQPVASGSSAEFPKTKLTPEQRDDSMHEH